MNRPLMYGKAVRARAADALITWVVLVMTSMWSTMPQPPRTRSLRPK